MYTVRCFLITYLITNSTRRREFFLKDNLYFLLVLFNEKKSNPVIKIHQVVRVVLLL